ncbi:MAG: 30S ribosomal protein S12 methylthiotransferase RimO [Synergistaceae bacterium]|jgi:ribosomal protein S12 methylthiotransferase|nr:30S ribosomal protein S12 methylthiotransferase RimO [Synergistaceae bacterium]
MGCAKNSVDSEHLIGMLEACGHRIVDDAGAAQVGLINTCAFIQDAVRENVDAILDLELLKERGQLEKIIVAGCIVNRYEAELRRELPLVDLWAGAENWDRIVAFLGGAEAQNATNCFSPSFPPGFPPMGGAPRGLLPDNRPWSRFLKVGEGCDTFCSYCTIPLIRGRLRSVPVPALVDEARALCAAGARELCLVGQDLTAYGRDVCGTPQIRELLTALDEALPTGTWLRLLYLHPERVTRGFLDFLAGTEKVLPYLDIPIQHIDDSILVAMNRAPAGAHIREIFRCARDRNPLFALRTTIMVGFPGETEEQFERVLEFLEEAEIDRVGAFVYSPEEGTKAALLPNQVPDEVREERYNRLMSLQAEISRERNAFFVGKKLRVLIEEIDLEGNSAWGRSWRDAPEVDGMVCVEGADLIPGSMVEVEITDAAEYDLFGRRALP